MVLLIAAHEGDEVAQHVASVAGTVGREVVRLDAASIGSIGWNHRLVDGRVATVLAPSGSPLVRSTDVGAVLNRVRWVAGPPFGSETDREYAVQELFAATLSFLAGFDCPVVNPPSGRALSGPSHSLTTWLYRASRAGLPVRSVVAVTDGRRWPRPGWERLPFAAVNPMSVAPPGPLPVATLPPGPRPAVWAEPIEDDVRTIDLVLGVPRGSHPAAWAEGLARLGAEAPLLQVHRGRTAEGVDVVTGVEPFPAVVGPDAVRALAAADRETIGSATR